MTRLSPFTRRLVAVSLLLIALALPYWLIVKPVLDQYSAYHAEITEQTVLRDRYRALTVNADERRKYLDRIRRESSDQGFYLTGESEALVAANLQNILKTIITGNNGKLTSTQVMQASEEHGFRQVTIRVRMSSPIDGVRRTIYALETERPFLFVDNLDINSRQQRGRLTETEEDPELTVTFDVHGYMRPSG